MGVRRREASLVVGQQGDAGVEQLEAVLLLQEVGAVTGVEVLGEVDRGPGPHPERLDELCDALLALVGHLDHGNHPLLGALRSAGRRSTRALMRRPAQDGPPHPGVASSGWGERPRASRARRPTAGLTSRTWDSRRNASSAGSSRSGSIRCGPSPAPRCPRSRSPRAAWRVTGPGPSSGTTAARCGPRTRRRWRTCPAPATRRPTRAALTAALGRAVRLVPTPEERAGVAPVHLVSRQAIDRAAAGDVPEGCSADDPRANLLLSLDGDDERTWVGRTSARRRRRPRGDADAEALPRRLRRGATPAARSPSATPSCSSLPPCRGLPGSRSWPPLLLPGCGAARQPATRPGVRPRRRRPAARELHARRHRRRPDPPGPGAHRRSAAGRRQLRLHRRPRPGGAR